MKIVTKHIFILTLYTLFFISGHVFAEEEAFRHRSTLISEVMPLKFDRAAKRPAPILEIGDPFLKTGPIQNGFTIPTGAVWQPSFMMWGAYRSALQSFYDGDNHTSEWANRFDLFGQINLTPTERIVAGLRVLDHEGNFTGYTFRAPDSVRDNGHGWDEEYNFYINTLFFEGDFAELFPNLDKEDKRSLDIAFSVGRQPISFQDGMLINDDIDALGISKINIKPPGAVNMRSAFVWSGNEINRRNLSSDDNDANLYGLFNEIDFRFSTIELDAIYVDSGVTGKGFYGGLGATQRIGEINTTFRALVSTPVDDQTDHNVGGVLLFSEISKTLKRSENFVYANAFGGINNFRSASRGPLAGGPLGQTGILFEAVGLGRYSSALSNDADEAFGGAIGYQMFFDHTRKQLILEAGGRHAVNETGQRAFGLATSYKMAVHNRGVIRLDAFVVYDDNVGAVDELNDIKYGGRIEYLHQF